MINSALSSAAFVQFMAESLLKATVILSLAAIIALLFRGRPIAYRAAIRNAALVSLIFLPIVSLMIPASLPVGIIPTEMVQPAQQNLFTDMAAKPQGSATTTRAISNTQSRDEHQGAVSQGGIDIFGPFMLVLWSIGSALILLRLFWQMVQVGRITSSGSLQDVTPLYEIALPLVDQLDIRRPVRILISDEIPVPFSYGLWQPVIVFPSSVYDWSTDHIRSVMLHELGHVARWDYLLQVLTEVVLALYWMHPLVWLYVRRSRNEREEACDDFALRNGISSDEYAYHLLDIARSIPKDCRNRFAIAMADKSTLFKRIKHIMDKKVDRSPLQGLALLLIFFLTMVLALPVGALQMFEMTAGIQPTTQHIRDLSNSRDERIRSRAAWWLGEHEDILAVESLIEALNDDAPKVRLMAAWALGEIKEKNAIEPLIISLDDPDPLVREMAVLALGEIEDRSAVRAIIKLSDADRSVRQAAIWALGEIGGYRAESARSELHDRLNLAPRDNSEVWAGEVGKRDLRYVSRPKYAKLDEMLEDLEDDDVDQRREAAYQLGLLGIFRSYESISEVEEVIDALIRATSDPVPEVRAMAVWSMDEINPSKHLGKADHP